MLKVPASKHKTGLSEWRRGPNFLSRRGVRTPFCLLFTLAAALGSGPAASTAYMAQAAPTANKITMWTADSSDVYTWVEPMLPEFTQQTGIQVDFQKYPEQGILDKYQVAMTAGSKDFDVVEAPQPWAPQYSALNAIAPLNPWLTDSNATPAEYNLADIPSTATAECTLGGQQYCLPVFGTVPLLWYNKSHFAQVGITDLPQSWSDVVADAGKLTNDQHAGICMRGSAESPNWFVAEMMMLYYLPYSPGNKGTFLDPSWNPTLATPEAHAFAQDYAMLMQKYAPKGVGTYTFPDCHQAFVQGRVSMWYDDSAISAQLYNAAQYPVSANIAPVLGFIALPCPPSNPNACMQTLPWGIFINANVSADRQNAGYELIKWITSKQTQLRGVQSTNDPAVATRLSVIDALISGEVSNDVPKDLLQALKYGYTHLSPNSFPQAAAFAEMQQPLKIALSNIITGQDSPAGALDSANSQTIDILKAAGLLNP